MSRPAAPLLLAASILFLPACSSPDRHLSRDTPRPPLAGSAAVRGGENGLELQWLVVDDRHAPVARTLARYAPRPTPLPASAVERWRAGGLRLVAVPLAELPDLLNSWPTIGPVSRQWLGQIPEWTDAVRGPTLDGTYRATVHGGETPVGPGRLRLLLRCWTVPAMQATEGRRAALHLELVPQCQNPRQADDQFLLQIGLERPTPPERDGALITSLAATMTMTEGDAYLIVPESPEVEWKEKPEAQDAPARGQAAEDAGADGKEESSAPAGEGGQETGTGDGSVPFVGPLGWDGMTFGELMLAPHATGVDGARRPRAIVVLIPHVPDRYELFAR